MPCCTISDSNNHERKFKVSGISFYRFLADEIKKKILAACKRADRFCISNARICSVHFTEAVYVRYIKSELLYLKSKKY